MKLESREACAKCGKSFLVGAKFCIYCGISRELSKTIPVKFNPRANVMAMVYGPPYSAKFICSQCRHTFTERGLGEPNDRFCPKCGNKCDCVESGRRF